MLEAEGFTPGDVRRAVARLREERALDDRGLAARHSLRRLQREGVGTRRIRAELARRGVGARAVQSGLGEALLEVPEAEALDAVARRFWRDKGRLEPPLRIRRLWAFLLRRGFPGPLVTARLGELWPRWVEALEGLEAAEEEIETQ